MSSRNHRLDSLRGIAAFAVLVHHAVHICNSDLVQRVLVPPLSAVPESDLIGRVMLSFAAGGMGVYVFFILSGCVLMASLQREVTFGLGTIIRFVGRRVLRIYPALIVAVIAFGAASYVALPAFKTRPFSLDEIVRNWLLLSPEVIGATWTLQTEMLMVPVILLAAWARSLVGTLALVALLFWSATVPILGAPFGGPLLTVAFPAFAMGMLVPAQITREAASRLPAWSALVFLAAMVAVRFYLSLNDVPGILLILGLGFCSIAVLYHRIEGKSLLDMHALLFLGRISYSLYLLHVLVIWEVFPWYGNLVGTQLIADHYVVFGLILGVIAAVITMPLAALSERFVERPLISFSHRIFSRRTSELRQNQGALSWIMQLRQRRIRLYRAVAAGTSETFPGTCPPPADTIA